MNPEHHHHLKMTYSNVFCWKKSFMFYWVLFLTLRSNSMTISQYWFRWWPGTKQMTSPNSKATQITAASAGLNSLRPRQNGRHFADYTFKRIFLNENIRISIKTSLKFVPKGPINNIPSLVQIMAWRRPGDKPLSEPVMVSVLTHICVTQPQWVNGLNTADLKNAL